MGARPVTGDLVKRLRSPDLESLFVATLVLFGFRLGVRPIGDNSMLTHLRTGIDMVGGGPVSGFGVPTADPYSYTAGGVPWVVQSWLPEWTYGWAHRFGGFRLVVLEQALLAAVLALVIVRLARAGSPLRTALAGTAAIMLGAPFWSPRPLLFGLLGLALTVTIVERRMTPWLLVPVVWLWVNSHGSFPLGLVWLLARATGELADWRAWPREAARYVWVFLAGLALAALNPLGSKLLTFPLTISEKQEALSRVIEWRSPDFQLLTARIALVGLVVALVVLMRARVAWRDALPVVAFVAFGLVAMRNLPAAAIVIAPVLARALRRPESAAPRGAPTAHQARTNRLLMATILAAFVVFGAAALAGDPLALDRYPVAAASFLDERGLIGGANRLAHRDVVGNYLTFRFGRTVRVFIDDRVDMFPLRVSEDYRTLLNGRSESLEVLDRYQVSAVLWERDRPLSTLLAVAPGWEQVYGDDDYLVFERT